ncbi:MAG: hypothetical protein WC683_14310 [bacterium]
MGDSMKNKIRADVNETVVRALNRYYFGKHSYTFTIPCGSEILDRYEGTSTLDGCTKIAHGSNLEARDLFVHYIFSEGIVPQSMRSQLTEPSGCYFKHPCIMKRSQDIMVGLPFIKWILQRDGLKVHGKAVTESTENYYCSPGNLTWLKSAFYYASDVSGSNEAYRRYTNGDKINAYSVFYDFLSSIVKRIEDKIGSDPDFKPVKAAIVIRSEYEDTPENMYEAPIMNPCRFKPQ